MIEFVTKFIMTYLRGVLNGILKINRILIPLFVYFRFNTTSRGFTPSPTFGGTNPLTPTQCITIIVVLAIVSLATHFALMFCGKDENNDR